MYNAEISTEAMRLLIEISNNYVQINEKFDVSRIPQSSLLLISTFQLHVHLYLSDRNNNGIYCCS